MIKSFKDLEGDKTAFPLPMDIFWRTRDFPKEKIYSLTSQIVSKLEKLLIVDGSWIDSNGVIINL